MEARLGVAVSKSMAIKFNPSFIVLPLYSTTLGSLQSCAFHCVPMLVQVLRVGRLVPTKTDKSRRLGARSTQNRMLHRLSALPIHVVIHVLAVYEDNQDHHNRLSAQLLPAPRWYGLFHSIRDNIRRCRNLLS